MCLFLIFESLQQKKKYKIIFGELILMKKKSMREKWIHIDISKERNIDR